MSIFNKLNLLVHTRRNFEIIMLSTNIQDSSTQSESWNLSKKTSKACCNFCSFWFVCLRDSTTLQFLSSRPVTSESIKSSSQACHYLQLLSCLPDSMYFSPRLYQIKSRRSSESIKPSSQACCLLPAAFGLLPTSASGCQTAGQHSTFQPSQQIVLLRTFISCQ